MPISTLNLPPHGESNWDAKLNAAFEALRVASNANETNTNGLLTKLSGGALNQVFGKKSAAEGDYGWITISPGGAVSSVAGKTGSVVLLAADISDSTSVGRGLLQAATSSDARNAIGAGTSSVVIGTGAGTAADAQAVTDALAGKTDLTVFNTFKNQKGQASGLAPLDATTKLALIYVPQIDIARLAPNTMVVVTRDGSGNWPARPTSRTDIIVCWKGIDPSPAIVSSGTGGMLDNVDIRMVVSA